MNEVKPYDVCLLLKQRMYLKINSSRQMINSCLDGGPRRVVKGNTVKLLNTNRAWVIV